MDKKDNPKVVRWKKKKHFLNRLMDRFGIVVDEFDIEDMIEDVESFENKPVHILDDGNSFHLFTVQGNEIVILFDWEFAVPVTVYLRAWFTENSEHDWEFKMKYKRKYHRALEKSQNYTIKTGLKSSFTVKY